MKFLLVLTLLAALLALPAAARADAEARAHTSVKLLECNRETRSATFQGAMKPYGDALVMEMKFRLKSRAAGRRRFTRVDAPPPFGQWLSSEPGVARYAYDKGVENLPVGVSYRVVVRFRFRDAAGAVIARAKRRSRQCRQPDRRPNLTVDRLEPAESNGDGTRSYEIYVHNAGAGDAPRTTLALDVNGQRFGFGALEVFGGDTEYERFDAPVCAPGSTVTVTLDVDDAVEERDETDNVLTVPCA